MTKERLRQIVNDMITRWLNRWPRTDAPPPLLPYDLDNFSQEPVPMSKPKLNENHLSHVIAERAPKMKERDRLDKEIRLLNSQIAEAMNEAGITTHQLMTGPLAGTVVQMIKPADRAVIVPERLLSLGVSPKVIEDSTKWTPVAAYPRVDAPKDQARAGNIAAEREAQWEKGSEAIELTDETPH